jgi:hypothetical protein
MGQTHEDLWAIGLDVGGTKIAGGLVRFPAAEVVRRQIIPTRAERGPEPVLSDAATLALDLSANVPHGERLAGLGLGVPELVDPQGRITSAQTIDWRGVPLTDRLADIGPVHVEAWQKRGSAPVGRTTSLPTSQWERASARRWFRMAGLMPARGATHSSWPAVQ